MRNYLLIVLLFALISGCFFSTISNFSEKDIEGKENLVLNSSFEDGEYHMKNLPEGWTILNQPENVVTWDSGTAHNSKKCLKFTYPTEKVNLISESFPVQATAVHYTKCFVKVNRPIKEQVALRFLAFDANGKKMNTYSKKITPKMDWTIIELTTGFFKPNTKFGRIIVTIPRKTNAIFWIDEIESYDVHRMNINKN
jgi:hypothetical protein